MPELSTLGGVLKTTYEGESNTNAYTDAEKSKLSGISDGADVSPVASVNGQIGAVQLTAADVNALPDSYTPPAAPVQSVNGQSGNVTLTAEDVGALPDSYVPEIGSVPGLELILNDLEQRLAALEPPEE